MGEGEDDDEGGAEDGDTGDGDCCRFDDLRGRTTTLNDPAIRLRSAGRTVCKSKRTRRQPVACSRHPGGVALSWNGLLKNESTTRGMSGDMSTPYTSFQKRMVGLHELVWIRMCPLSPY